MKHTTRKTRTSIIRRALSALLVLSMLFVCAGCSKKTPREALTDAYEKTFITEAPIETALGLAALKEAQKTGSYSGGLSMTLQEISGAGLGAYSALLSGIGFSIDSASDVSNEVFDSTMDITYGGTTYITLGGQLNKSKLYLTSPQLLDGSLSVDFATLEKDLASDSLLAQVLRASDITLPKDFGTNFQNSIKNPLAGSDEITSAWNSIHDAITVEEAEKDSLLLPPDVSAKKLYLVTLPKDSYASAIKATMKSLVDSSNSVLTEMEEVGTESIDLSEFNSSIDNLSEQVGDIVVKVAVSKKGYITYAESEIKSDTETFTLKATFSDRTESPYTTKINFSANVQGQSLKATYEESFDKKENTITFATNVSKNNETLIKLSGEGEYSDIEKGKKYTLDFNYLELELADTLSVSLSGKYYIDTTKCDIKTPSGTEHRLFSMSEQDFTDLFTEITTNLSNDPLLSTLLQLGDFGI